MRLAAVRLGLRRRDVVSRRGQRHAAHRRVDRGSTPPTSANAGGTTFSLLRRVGAAGQSSRPDRAPPAACARYRPLAATARRLDRAAGAAGLLDRRSRVAARRPPPRAIHSLEGPTARASARGHRRPACRCRSAPRAESAAPRRAGHSRPPCGAAQKGPQRCLNLRTGNERPGLTVVDRWSVHAVSGPRMLKTSLRRR